MKRKIYELNFDQSTTKFVTVYKTDNDKWQKQKCQSPYNKIGIPVFSIKKNKSNQWINDQIKIIDKALNDNSHSTTDQGIFVIKQKSQFKDEVKVAVFGAPGFADKLFRDS